MLSKAKSRKGNTEMMKIRNGFTLIELMVVIAIIGILTALVTVNLQDARERARDVQRKADVKSIQQALELYKNDRIPQVYPPTASWRTDLTTGGYIKAIPADPTYASSGSWEDYSYTRGVDPLEFSLVACLENTADINKDPSDVCLTYGVSYTLNAP